MKKVELERKLYSVVDMEDYSVNSDLYNPRTTAIEVAGLVLPVRNPAIDNGVGIYIKKPEHGQEMVADVIKPAPEREAEYSAEKVIDFSRPSDITEIISKNEMLRDLQSDLMVNNDGNTFFLTIGPQDTPEMKALKTAINAKQIDKRAYEDRFPQFQNDMRLLKGNTITLGKMITVCNGFDISCTITLRDKDGAINPMGTEVTMDLTEGRPSKNEPV